MPSDKPRRGRPPLADAKLTDIARILRPAAAKLPDDVREKVRLATRIANPGYLTVGAVLRLIRPKDRDGGWGWFGRALMNKGEK